MKCYNQVYECALWSHTSSYFYNIGLSFINKPCGGNHGNVYDWLWHLLNAVNVCNVWWSHLVLNPFRILCRICGFSLNWENVLQTYEICWWESVLTFLTLELRNILGNLVRSEIQYDKITIHRTKVIIEGLYWRECI